MFCRFVQRFLGPRHRAKRQGRARLRAGGRLAKGPVDLLSPEGCDSTEGARSATSPSHRRCVAYRLARLWRDGEVGRRVGFQPTFRRLRVLRVSCHVMRNACISHAPDPPPGRARSAPPLGSGARFVVGVVGVSTHPTAHWSLILHSRKDKARLYAGSLLSIFCRPSLLLIAISIAFSAGSLGSPKARLFLNTISKVSLFNATFPK